VVRGEAGGGGEVEVGGVRVGRFGHGGARLTPAACTTWLPRTHSDCCKPSACLRDRRALSLKDNLPRRLRSLGSPGATAPGLFLAPQRHEGLLSRRRIQPLPLHSSSGEGHEPPTPLSRVLVAVKGFEEKETDVAIAVKMLELAHSGRTDCLVLMSGDTDLCPAVDGVHRMFPSLRQRIAFPYERYNKDLDRRADGRFRISPRLMAANQFSDPYVLKSGRVVQKPPGW